MSGENAKAPAHILAAVKSRGTVYFYDPAEASQSKTGAGKDLLEAACTVISAPPAKSMCYSGFYSLPLLNLHLYDMSDEEFGSVARPDRVSDTHMYTAKNF